MEDAGSETVPRPLVKILSGLISRLRGVDYRERVDSKQRSQAIDAYLAKERTRSRRFCNILIFGDNQQDAIFWKKMRLVGHPLAQDELADLKIQSRRVAIKALSTLLDEVLSQLTERGSEKGEPISDEILSELEHLRSWAQGVDSEQSVDLTVLDDLKLDTQLREVGIDFDALQREVLDWELHALRHHSHQGSPTLLDYVRRVLSPDYEPSEDDWLHLDQHRGLSAVDETTVERQGHGGFSFNFLLLRARNSRSKWIHLLQDSSAVVFVADLAVIDDRVFEKSEYDLPKHDLEGALALYISVAMSKRFLEVPILLILANVASFRRQFRKGTLPDTFYCYEANNAEAALDFLENKFRQVYRVPAATIYRVESLDLADQQDILDLLESRVLRERLEDLE